MNLKHWLLIGAGVDLLANVAANNLSILGSPVTTTGVGGVQTTLPSWYASTFGNFDAGQLPMGLQLWEVLGLGALIAHFA
jgi:hypothetical protein